MTYTPVPAASSSYANYSPSPHYSYSPSYSPPAYSPSYPSYPASYPSSTHDHHEYYPTTYHEHYEHDHEHYPSYHTPHHHHEYHYPHYDHHYPHYGHHHYPSSSSHGSGSNSLVSAASLLVPLLGLVGLSLLVPNVVRLPAKRDTGAVGAQDDKDAQQLMTMYLAVLNSEECIQRLFCEMGQLAKNAKNKTGLLKLMENMVPPEFQKEVDIIKTTASTPDATCSKMVCSPKMDSPPVSLPNNNLTT